MKWLSLAVLLLAMIVLLFMARAVTVAYSAKALSLSAELAGSSSDTGPCVPYDLFKDRSKFWEATAGFPFLFSPALDF